MLIELLVVGAVAGYVGYLWIKKPEWAVKLWNKVVSFFKSADDSVE